VNRSTRTLAPRHTISPETTYCPPHWVRARKAKEVLHPQTDSTVRRTPTSRIHANEAACKSTAAPFCVSRFFFVALWSAHLRHGVATLCRTLPTSFTNLIAAIVPAQPNAKKNYPPRSSLPLSPFLVDSHHANSRRRKLTAHATSPCQFSQRIQ